MYKNAEEIDFSKLPQSFVLKTNHDCRGVVIVSNKDTFLQDTSLREWHYKDIEPRIFAEELLGEEVQDFRFHCFDEKIGFIQVANATHTHNDCFDIYWNAFDFTYLNPKAKIPPDKPHFLESMCAIAQSLSNTLGYVRVDLYSIGQKVYVGELTFTPNGGTGKFNPRTYDEVFGRLWQ
ncbi:MAG: glycosyl transferase [Helicobacter sp.]|nr:glycosyl transferase [Helicobacter sp.]